MRIKLKSGNLPRHVRAFAHRAKQGNSLKKYADVFIHSPHLPEITREYIPKLLRDEAGARCDMQRNLFHHFQKL